MDSHKYCINPSNISHASQDTVMRTCAITSIYATPLAKAIAIRLQSSVVFASKPTGRERSVSGCSFDTHRAKAAMILGSWRSQSLTTSRWKAEPLAKHPRCVPPQLYSICGEFFPMYLAASSSTPSTNFNSLLSLQGSQTNLNILIGESNPITIVILSQSPPRRGRL